MPFAKVWGIAFGVLTAVALLVPLIAGDPDAADRAIKGQLAADTLRSAQRLRDAISSVASAESLHLAERASLSAMIKAPPAAARPSAPVATLPQPARASSPALAALGARIDRAKRERSVATWIALSEDESLSKGPRVRGLVDSLRAFDSRAEAVSAGVENASARDVLRQRTERAGRTIVAIAENRLAELTAGATGTAPALAPAVAPAVVPESPRATAPSVANGTRLPDTTASRDRLRSAQEALARARSAHDSLTAISIANAAGAAPREPGPSLASASPAIATIAIMLLGLFIRFSSALRAEMRAPTLADAGEAERLARAPVLTTVREAMIDGPARFHPSGIDPFRILYLGLTATGTRVRSAIVTGSDVVIAAATGARLAIAAAADHRQTLVVDLDPVNIPLSRTFRERAEPGMSDALARAFTWREVARPVGSSDGLTITLLPAGTERDDLATGAELDELLESFARLRSGYELTIIVAPPDRLALAARLVDAGPVILTVAVGETTLATLETEAGRVRAAQHRLQGMVLWDADRPELPSRAELAALLSKRKGRTPGGSFEAVQRLVSPRNSANRKTQ